MAAALLELLRSIPDRRRAEGKRFDLATVLLYSILGMVAEANSYRQMHEFICIHRQRLNEAFGLALRCAQSRHSNKRGRLFNAAKRLAPQAGQTKPSGQRRSNMKAA